MDNNITFWSVNKIRENLSREALAEFEKRLELYHDALDAPIRNQGTNLFGDFEALDHAKRQVREFLLAHKLYDVKPATTEEIN